MTPFPLLPPVPPPSGAEPVADLLLQALHCVQTTDLLNLLLDRIEAAR